ncbi:radical SAM protein [Azospirillum cavernae]|uniref:Radical SAM protein n=1 Tax=Azospirillum cavernae TaxID=2320860 RepID=A0A418VKT3_9PROT|nr:radical SAM protein [Azospirillum cavernae]RJF76750.1 radical SAM protein [Azospirillum cavernae]
MKFFITEDDMCTTQKLNLARVQTWLEANGGCVVSSPEEADRLLCMTCNGWSLLEQSSYDRIQRYAKDHADKMIVMGCVNDAHPAKVAEIWSGPTVRTAADRPYSFGGIEALFPEFKVRLADVPAQSVFRRKEDYRDYNLSKRFINIAEGCAFHCTFCTHKPGLGNRRSRPLDEILQQIAQCVEEGVRIINLMGMETALYGLDVDSDFSRLLKAVLEFHDSYEVHVAQFNPTGIHRYYDALLPLFQNKRVTDVQLPIQTTSARLLKMMNRRDHSERVGSFMAAVRAANPRVVLRTDLIVGWPTETAEERQASLDFAGQHFDEIALYTIELSPDLPAWKYQDQAFPPKTLEEIRRTSADYLNARYDVVVHSGQQDDRAMATAEAKRKALRARRAAA